MGASRKTRVAFGENSRYENVIRSKLDARFEAVFADLSSIDMNSFDLVVPLHLKHYEELQGHADLNGRKFLAPSRETVELCHDKLALKSFLTANGFGAFTPRLRAAGDFPFVMKRRRSEWGQGVRIVQSAEDFADLEFDTTKWMFEEHLDSHEEYAFHILAVNGRPVFQMRSSYKMSDNFQIKGRDVKPVSWLYEREFSCPSLFEDIAFRLNYTGTLCIDYKIINDIPKIMEINPRFGGSLMVDINRYLDAYAAALVSDPADLVLAAASR